MISRLPVLNVSTCHVTMLIASIQGFQSHQLTGKVLPAWRFKIGNKFLTRKAPPKLTDVPPLGLRSLVRPGSHRGDRGGFLDATFGTFAEFAKHVI